ncbi:MAG: dTMP kinase [Candidatus Nitrosocosmicus sp.]
MNKNDEHKKKDNGKIVVIEGLDKSGKTTQYRLLYNFYSNNYPGQISLLNFPDYTTRIGKEIELFLHGKVNYTNEVKHILLSANRWEKKSEIEQLKEKNKLLIINRYYQSNLVYGLANDMNFDWLFNLDKGLPKEDIVIVLDIDPSISYKRSIDNNFVMDEFEKNISFLGKVRDAYLNLSKLLNWNVIPAYQSDPVSIMNSIIKIIHVDK